VPTNWSVMLKDNPLIVNTYKRKVEFVRQSKRDKKLTDELTREDLEPILVNALNMVKTNTPPGMKAPKDTDELIMMFRDSGIAGVFGIRDSEMSAIGGASQEQGEGGITLEQLMAMSQQQQPIIAPMPQGNAQLPRQVVQKISPQIGGMTR
jgi:hypothetical protein